MKELVGLVLVIAWMAGIQLASNAATFWAAVFPPYAWYIVVGHIMQAISLPICG